MKFESAMADVGKVVDFSEADGLQKMGNSLKELSRSIPLSVEGLAQITAAGGQLGVKECQSPDCCTKWKLAILDL